MEGHRQLPWGLAMQRRQFLLLSGAAAAVPFAAHAQPLSKKPIIAYLSGGTRASRVTFLASFSKGMRELGWIEGQSFSMEARYADGYFDRIPKLADELLKLDPDVFLVSTTPANLAAKQNHHTKADCHGRRR
jgi:putative ABC transport system substrate-binding protein